MCSYLNAIVLDLFCVKVDIVYKITHNCTYVNIIVTSLNSVLNK